VVSNWFELLYYSGAIVAKEPSFSSAFYGILLKLANDWGNLENVIELTQNYPFINIIPKDTQSPEHEIMLKYFRGFIKSCLDNSENLEKLLNEFSEYHRKITNLDLSVLSNLPASKAWSNEAKFEAMVENTRKTYDALVALKSLVASTKKDWQRLSNIMENKEQINALTKFAAEGYKKNIRDQRKLFWSFIDVTKIDRFYQYKDIRKDHLYIIQEMKLEKEEHKRIESKDQEAERNVEQMRRIESMAGHEAEDISKEEKLKNQNDKVNFREIKGGMIRDKDKEVVAESKSDLDDNLQKQGITNVEKKTYLSDDLKSQKEVKQEARLEPKQETRLEPQEVRLEPKQEIKQEVKQMKKEEVRQESEAKSPVAHRIMEAN